MICRRTDSAEEPLLLDTSREREPSLTLSPEGSTVFQTVLSILNIVMGIGILSMPYCMSLSGIAGLGTVMLCCFLFCTSGKCIAWSMELLPAGKPKSYPQLGEEAMAAAGRRLVSFFAVLDLTGGSCIMMIVLWQSVTVRHHAVCAMQSAVRDCIADTRAQTCRCHVCIPQGAACMMG